jgi:hypothetical protein
MLTLTLAGLLMGCEVKIYDDTGSTGADDTDDTDETGSTNTDDTDETNTEDPEVTDGSIECQSSEDNEDPYNLYYVDVNVIDPQGSSDLATTGSKVFAYDEDGSLIFSDDLLVCTSDHCFGSFREDSFSSLDCDAITEQRFTAEIFDKDGNSSGEAKLTALIPEA